MIEGLNSLWIGSIEIGQKFIDIGEVTLGFPSILRMIISFPFNEVLDTSTSFSSGEYFLYIVFGEVIDDDRLWRRRRNLTRIGWWVIW